MSAWNRDIHMSGIPLYLGLTAALWGALPPSAGVTTRVDKDSGVAMHIITDTPAHPHPNFSPDGRKIAFTFADGPNCQVAWVEVAVVGRWSVTSDQ